MKKIILSLLIVSIVGSLNACESGFFENLGKKTDDYAQKADDAAHNRGPAQKAGNRADKHLS